MENKPQIIVQKNPPHILKQRILIPDNVGVCINCEIESVKIESDDEAPKNNKTQE
jgi:hypothetical protein